MPSIFWVGQSAIASPFAELAFKNLGYAPIFKTVTSLPEGAKFNTGRFSLAVPAPNTCPSHVNPQQVQSELLVSTSRYAKHSFASALVILSDGHPQYLQSILHNEERNVPEPAISA